MIQIFFILNFKRWILFHAQRPIYTIKVEVLENYGKEDVHSINVSRNE